MLKILSSLFFPAVFCIFIFILLYLITAIPLSVSFIPFISLFPFFHPRFQSYLSLSTSRIQSNSSPCFIPLKAPPSGHSVSFLSIHPSLYQVRSNVISKASPTKLLCENCFTDEKKTYFHSSIHPSLPQSLHPSFHSSIHISSLFHTKYFPASMSAGAFHYIHTHVHIQYVHTHTQTLKYRASSDPNHRKGDGGS